MNCIYCTNEISKPSLEHIVPSALGGALLDSRFKTRRVCERCNNVLGLYADGLYVKSLFSIANQSLSIGNIEQLENHPKVYPLCYFGCLDIGHKMGFENCEMWMSPCKGRVFHFHNNKDESYFSYAGGNPILRKITPGLTLFLNVSNDSEVLALGLKSFYKHFKKSERVVSYVVFDDGIDPELGRYPNDLELNWIDWYQTEIVKKLDGRHPAKKSIQLGCADRMLAKIALGLGVNLFGEDFLKINCSKSLRDYMWQQDWNARKLIGVLRYDTFGLNERLYSLFELDASDVSIIVALHRLGVMLTMNIFGDEQSIVITTSDILVLRFYEEFGDGFVYTVSPLYEISSGPHELMIFISRQLNAMREKEGK